VTVTRAMAVAKCGLAKFACTCLDNGCIWCTDIYVDYYYLPNI